MQPAFDLTVLGGTVWTVNGPERTDIGIAGGRIAAFGDLARARSAATFDAAGLTVLPGAIDTQVHFREPGLTHKEDLESGTAGAAIGGVTAVFEMPNTNPNTLDGKDIA
ncbi:MAG: dihydroorotase, partial [Dongia sp.]